MSSIHGLLSNGLRTPSSSSGDFTGTDGGTTSTWGDRAGDGVSGVGSTVRSIGCLTGDEAGFDACTEGDGWGSISISPAGAELATGGGSGTTTAGVGGCGGGSGTTTAGVGGCGGGSGATTAGVGGCGGGTESRGGGNAERAPARYATITSTLAIAIPASGPICRRAAWAMAVIRLRCTVVTATVTLDVDPAPGRATVGSVSVSVSVSVSGTTPIGWVGSCSRAVRVFIGAGGADLSSSNFSRTSRSVGRFVGSFSSIAEISSSVWCGSVALNADGRGGHSVACFSSSSYASALVNGLRLVNSSNATTPSA